MRRFTLLLLVLVLVIFAAPVYAGVFGDITEGVKEALVTVLLSGAILIWQGVLSYLHKKNARLIENVGQNSKEGGEFITQFGNAVLSGTKEDAEKMVKEARDVFDVNRPTPKKYKTP
jgi:O-methyltransferase involved in polyketide biosynthesis